jgi:hypothetical protein
VFSASRAFYNFEDIPTKIGQSHAHARVDESIARTPVEKLSEESVGAGIQSIVHEAQSDRAHDAEQTWVVVPDCLQF